MNEHSPDEERQQSVRNRCSFHMDYIKWKSKSCEHIFVDKYHQNTLKVINHTCGSICHEYIIWRKPFNLSRWFILTIIFSTCAFQYELYNKDLNLLGVLLVILCFILLVKLHYKVKEESLLVVASLGLQLSTKFVTGHTSSKFIHLGHIQDIVIIEGITMHQVLFYLAILLKDASSNQILPIFQYTYPSLEILQRIYRGVQKTLFNTMKS